MKIEDIIKNAISEEGGMILSEATLKTDDLLGAFYEFLETYNLNEALRREIRRCFDEEPTICNLFYGRCKLIPEKEEEAVYILNEDCFNYFEEIAPEGYYFGSAEGDGACIGWFKFEEEDY